MITSFVFKKLVLNTKHDILAHPNCLTLTPLVAFSHSTSLLLPDNTLWLTYSKFSIIFLRSSSILAHSTLSKFVPFLLQLVQNFQFIKISLIYHIWGLCASCSGYTYKVRVRERVRTWWVLEIWLWLGVRRGRYDSITASDYIRCTRQIPMPFDFVLKKCGLARHRHCSTWSEVVSSHTQKRLRADRQTVQPVQYSEGQW